MNMRLLLVILCFTFTTVRSNHDYDHFDSMFDIDMGHVDEEPLDEEGPPIFDCAVPEVTNGYINANGQILAPRAIVLPGTEIRLSCWNNTVLLGSGKAICIGSKLTIPSASNGDEWQPHLGTCIKHPGCGRPPFVTGGIIDTVGESAAGATRLIKCYDGYMITGPSYVRCNNDMSWSTPGSCVPLPAMAVLDVTQCVVPERANGQIYTRDGPVSRGSILLANTEIGMTCREGYVANGTMSSLCSSWDGKWTPPLGECVEQLKCGRVPAIMGGEVEEGNYTIGSIRLIKCGFAFNLNGRSYIKCLPNATWSEPGWCLHTTTFGAITEAATMRPFIENLRRASQQGNTDRMLELIEAGRNVNDVTLAPNSYPRFCQNVWNYHDPNPLRLASACNRSADVIRLLLDDAKTGSAGSVNERNNEGFTPLMYAADNGNLEVVKLLVERGADVNARNNEGYTPLIYASWSGQNATVKYLLDKGAYVNARNRRGYTALILAAHNGYADVTCQLLDRGANINARNVLGHTALIYAARFGYADTARLLLSRGASHRGCRYELCRPANVPAGADFDHSTDSHGFD